MMFDPSFSTKEKGKQKGMELGLATSYSNIPALQFVLCKVQVKPAISSRDKILDGPELIQFLSRKKNPVLQEK